MYLKYGTYTHGLNECEVTISRQSLFNEGQQRYGYKETWDVKGRLMPATQTQAGVTAAINALRTAYGQQNEDLGLYLADGSTLTSHQLSAANSISGTYLEDISFPEGTGAEYTEFRTYTLRVSAEFRDTGVPLLAWVESISFSGGGPLFGHLEPLNGDPIPITRKEKTVYRVTQQGSAIGQFDYPPVAPAIWPGALKEAPRIVRKSPKRYGPPGKPKYVEFPVEWTYEFESAGALVGNPTRWTIG